MPEKKNEINEPKKPGDAAIPAEPAKAPGEQKPEMRPNLGQKPEAAPAPAAPAAKQEAGEKAAPPPGEAKDAVQPGKADRTAGAKKPDAAMKPGGGKPAPAEVAKKNDGPAKPVEGKPAPAEADKKPDASAKPREGKPAPAEAAKKPDPPAKHTEAKPAPAEAAKKNDGPAKPAEGKSAPAEAAKKPDTPAKATETKLAPAEATKKPDAPAEATKKPDAPAKPGENKPSQAEPPKKPDEPAKHAEAQKKAEGPAKAPAADPQKKQGDKEKAGAAGLGLAITRIFADRLDYPDEKAMQALPVPKEGEGFSMRLHPAYFREFLDHPFSVNREVKDYKELYESIRDNGISEPVLARPGKNGGLELISGHRRHDIARQLNYPVPVVIRQIDDDSAQIAVVDGNLHRQDIPTSELARAAKMKMDALARKAGRRSKMDQLKAPMKRTDEIVGEDMGMSRNQVQRLVRIDALVPELKKQVDEKKLPMNTAVELSYLKPEEQAQVVDVMQREQVTPTMAQATQLKEASRQAASLAKTAPTVAASHKVDEKKVSQIIKPKADPPLKVTFTEVELKAYFPSPLPSPFAIKQTIYEALTMRNKALAKQAAKDAAKDAGKKPVKPVR